MSERLMSSRVRALLLTVLLVGGAPELQAQEPQVSAPMRPPQEGVRPRFALVAELSSFYLATRPSLSLEARLLSGAEERLHLLGRVGFGAMSFYLGPPKLDAHATVSLLTGRRAHHVELRGGVDWVSNTLSGDGSYLYPLLGAGYRYQRREGRWLFTVMASTTGLSLGGGWAF